MEKPPIITMKKALLLLTIFITSLSASAQVTNESTIKPSDFSNFLIEYSADPSHFDTGYYGFNINGYFGDTGFGGSFGMMANYGIVDDGGLMYKFGPIYGYPVSKNLMVGAKLRGFIYTYNYGDESKVNGGITVTPGLTFKFGKLLLNAGFEFGWLNKANKLYKQIELGIGIQI